MKKLLIIIIAIIGFTAPSYSQFASDRYSDVRDEGWLKKGYRGFVELGGGGCAEFADGSFFINTTHGYQFSEWIFAGAGLGYLGGCYDDLFEFYGDMRVTVPTNSRFYPFADFKLGGATHGDTRSVYINGELGVRFALNETFGLSLGVYCNYVDDSFAHAPILGGAVGFDF